MTSNRVTLFRCTKLTLPLTLVCLFANSCGKLKGDDKSSAGETKTIAAVNNSTVPKAAVAVDGLKIVSVSPPEDAKAVGRANRIEVVFNEALATDIDASKLLKLQDGPQMYAVGSVEVEGATLRFLPAQAMKANAPHVVNLSGTLRAKSGHTLDLNKTWKFQTSLTNDTSLPTLVGTFPAQVGTWASGVPFMFHYDEALHVDSLKFDLDVFDTNGAQLEAKSRLVSNTLLVDLAKPLTLGARELRFVTKVLDLDANLRVLDQKINFTVVDAFAPQALELVTITPNGANDRKVRESVTLKFNRPLDPASLNASQIWVGNKSLNGSPKFPFSFLVVGDSVKLSFGEGLNYSSQYEIASNGALKSVMGGSALASADITLSQFTTQTALAIASSNIVNGAMDVPLNTQLQLNFSKPLLASTFTKDSVSIRDEFQNKVSGEWSVSGGAATFSGVFSKSKKYQFTFDSNVRATDDSSFASNLVFGFDMVKDAGWEASSKAYVTAACSNCHASFLDRDVVLSRKSQIYTSVNTGRMPKATPPAPYASQTAKDAFLSWLNAAN
jgi:hypothetical protein